LALINIGLGIQLYGDGAAPQAIWYLLVIAAVGTYGFLYWRIHLQKRKRANDSFDPSPFEDPAEDGGGGGGPKPYEPLRTVNVAAMSDNDLGTYRSEYYDPDESGVNEYGARVGNTRPQTGARPQTGVRPPTGVRPQTGNVPTITAVNRPATVVPSTSVGRRYDTPTVAGPYGSTEPLRPVQSDPQVDPFADPHRPRTGRSQAPYPVSTVSAEETMPSASAPAYNAPQYNAPQYTAPQYGAPQYTAPSYDRHFV
jgi:hypothetical protein